MAKAKIAQLFFRWLKPTAMNEINAGKNCWYNRAEKLYCKSHNFIAVGFSQRMIKANTVINKMQTIKITGVAKLRSYTFIAVGFSQRATNRVSIKKINRGLAKTCRT